MVIFRALVPSPDNRSTSSVGIIEVEAGTATVAETELLPECAKEALLELVGESYTTRV